MLNPIKTPTQMMLEQAGIPHLASGKLVGDVLSQFANRIQEAIRKYTKITGKAPSPEEIKKLEEHIKSYSQPSPQTPQTQARLAQQTPYASHLVDEYGRPYKPMPHPQTGVLTTPERAQGYTMADQFGKTPINMAARKKQYEKNVNVFPEDPFMSVANVNRLPSRTYQRSATPSSEEVLARQAADEASSANLPGGSYGFEEGPMSASAPFANQAESMVARKINKSNEDILPSLYSTTGEKTPYTATIERIRQDFRARGIEPDDQDILNAFQAEQNLMRHDYTGVNPISQRPMVDPRGGKTLQEMQDWRQQMRMSGRPETEVTSSPSDWNPASKRDYLLDMTPDTRQPFASEWDINALEDARRKRVPRKAIGGLMSPQQPSARDMRAEMLAAGQNPMQNIVPGAQPFGIRSQSAAQPFGRMSQSAAQPFNQTQNQNVGMQPFGQQSQSAAQPFGMPSQSMAQPFGQTNTGPEQRDALLKQLFATQDVPHFGGGGSTSAGEEEMVLRALRQGMRYPSAADEVMSRQREQMQPEMRGYHPTPRQRISDLGTKFLRTLNTPYNTARRGGETIGGGPQSMLPAGMGLIDAAAFNPAGFVATAPVWAPEMAHRVSEGDYTDALLSAPGLAVAGKLGKTAYQMGRGVNPRMVAATVMGAASNATNANETEPEYESVLERNFPR